MYVPVEWWINSAMTNMILWALGSIIIALIFKENSLRYVWHWTGGFALGAVVYVYAYFLMLGMV